MESIWYVLGSFHSILRTRLTDLSFDPQTQRRALALKNSLLQRLSLLQPLQPTNPEIYARTLERISRLYHALAHCYVRDLEITFTIQCMFAPPRFLHRADEPTLIQAVGAGQIVTNDDDDVNNSDCPVDDFTDTDPPTTFDERI